MQKQLITMKTSKIIRAITLTLIAALYISVANAQDEEDLPLEYQWTESTVGTGTKAYLRQKNRVRNVSIYINKQYDEENILNEYPGWFNAHRGFLGYKTDLHNVFVSVVREAIGMEKVRTLAGRNEQFGISFRLDQNGKILMISFSLDTTTLVTTDELYNMEELIKARFSFVPIRRTSIKLGCGFGIETTFGEILAGEIPSLKRKELRQRKTEADFGD